jgi:hypothetical protein
LNSYFKYPKWTEALIFILLFLAGVVVVVVVDENTGLVDESGVPFVER